MNELHPTLKQLTRSAAKAERCLDQSSEQSPPRDMVLRVIRLAHPATSGIPSREVSLFEVMVARAAAIAAIVGLIMLTIQFSGNGPFTGLLHNTMTHSSVLLHAWRQ